MNISTYIKYLYKKYIINDIKRKISAPPRSFSFWSRTPSSKTGPERRPAETQSRFGIGLQSILLTFCRLPTLSNTLHYSPCFALLQCPSHPKSSSMNGCSAGKAANLFRSVLLLFLIALGASSAFIFYHQLWTMFFFPWCKFSRLLSYPWGGSWNRNHTFLPTATDNNNHPNSSCWCRRPLLPPAGLIVFYFLVLSGALSTPELFLSPRRWFSLCSFPSWLMKCRFCANFPNLLFLHAENTL